MLSKYLTEKVEKMTTSLFTFILLWAAKLHIRLCNNNNHPKQRRNRQCSYGLRTLIQSEKAKLGYKILHCYNLAVAAPKAALESSSSWSWPSSPVAFQMGDVIGTESGYCMMSDVAEQVGAEGFSGGAYREKRERERERRRRKREIPPPITLLSDTARMPWNFTRECGDDGRLIVRAVKRREYVEGNREISGRVIMRLVQQDDEDDDDDNNDNDGADFCEECGWRIDEEEEEEGVEFDGGLEGFDEEEEEEESAIAKEEEASRLESESEQCGDLHRGVVSYSAGVGWVGDGGSGCLSRPASVPIMPMTPVM